MCFLTLQLQDTFILVLLIFVLENLKFHLMLHYQKV